MSYTLTALRENLCIGSIVSAKSSIYLVQGICRLSPCQDLAHGYRSTVPIPYEMEMIILTKPAGRVLKHSRLPEVSIIGNATDVT